MDDLVEDDEAIESGDESGSFDSIGEEMIGRLVG